MLGKLRNQISLLQEQSDQISHSLIFNLRTSWFDFYGVFFCVNVKKQQQLSKYLVILQELTVGASEADKTS